MYNHRSNHYYAVLIIIIQSIKANNEYIIIVMTYNYSCSSVEVQVLNKKASKNMKKTIVLVIKIKCYILFKFCCSFITENLNL